jgi:hypothetical protein
LAVHPRRAFQFVVPPRFKVLLLSYYDRPKIKGTATKQGKSKAI